MNRLQQLADNTSVNISAVASTIFLSFSHILEWLTGLLPTLSLFLSTITIAVLLYYHLRNIKLTNLKIRELEEKNDEKSE